MYKKKYFPEVMAEKLIKKDLKMSVCTNAPARIRAITPTSKLLPDICILDKQIIGEALKDTNDDIIFLFDSGNVLVNRKYVERIFTFFTKNTNSDAIYIRKHKDCIEFVNKKNDKYKQCYTIIIVDYKMI